MSKQQIRFSSFETNSSSSHSFIGLDQVCSYDTMLPDSEGVINILTDGEYGWGYETYDSPWERAAYILMDCQGNDEYVEIVKELIRNHTGAREVNVEWGDGYIDHQSIGVGRSMVTDGPLALKNAIFGIGCYLEIDNDNH